MYVNTQETWHYMTVQSKKKKFPSLNENKDLKYKIFLFNCLLNTKLSGFQLELLKCE